MKRFRFLISVLLFLFLLPAYAQFANADGAFRSQGGNVRLQIIVFETDKGTVAASTTVTQGVCAGEVSGIGKIVARRLTFSPYVKEEGGESCVISVDFDSKFQTGRISANQSCRVYHGASCGWEGQVLSKVRSR